MSGSRAASMEIQVTGIAVTAAQRRNPMSALNVHAPYSRPLLMRFLVRSWEYRRPRLWVGLRRLQRRAWRPDPGFGALAGPAGLAGRAAAGGSGADLLDRLPPAAGQC